MRVEDDRHDRVVVQVGTHARERDPDVDVVFAEVLGRADAREHQQLRRVHGAAAQDHLAAGSGGVLGAALRERDSRGAVTVELDPTGRRLQRHREVGAGAGRLDVRLIGRPAAPALAGHLVQARALLLGPVEIAVARHTELDCAVDPIGHQRVRVHAVLDGERAVGAVVAVVETGVALGLDEVRQHIVVRPAGGAVVALPRVEIAVVPADVDHGVHRRAAAQCLHPRPIRGAVVQVLLRGGGVVPVPLRFEQRGERQRDVHLVGVRFASRLEQQHGDAGVLAEPGRHDGTRASRSHHDVVVFVRRHTCSLDWIPVVLA